MSVAVAAQRRTSAEQDQSPPHCVWGPSTLVLTSGSPWTGLAPVWSCLELAGGLWNPPKFPLALRDLFLA